jgi:uncharacterized protein YeaO (DUF488 family)
MIKIKHLMDAVEGDDGQRIWVEPFGVTRDLREWCAVSHVLSHLGPPMALWEWYEEHANGCGDGYDFFRARYHDFLSKGPYKAALQKLACAGRMENFTLLYEGEDPQHNTATALYEFLSELGAYCPPDL